MSTLTHSLVRTRGASPVVVLAFIVFLAGIGSWGALIGLKFVTQKSVDSLRSDIVAFKDEFRSQEVQEMIRTARSLNAANALLEQHHIITPIFQALEQKTLPSVHYSNFSYDAREGTLTLGASAANERIFAEQLIVLRETPIFQTLEFGNPNIKDGGALDFTMTMNVRNSDIYPLRPQQ